MHAGVPLDANTPSSCKFSVNSSDQSGTSRNRLPCTGTVSFFFLVWVSVGSRVPVPGYWYFDVVLLPDLMKYHQTCPALTMQEKNL